MKAIATSKVLRAAKAAAFSAALVSTAFAAGAALGQVAPPIGVEPGTPGVSMPQLPPPVIPPGSSKNDDSSVNAPLATSAQGCQSDIGGLQSRRMVVLNELNGLAKANKGKLDPVTACPRFRKLVAIETQFRDYLIKNQDWCSVPSEVVDSVKESTSKDMATSVKACKLAADFKKAQAQGALGAVSQAQRLPAGPL